MIGRVVGNMMGLFPVMLGPVCCFGLIWDEIGLDVAIGATAFISLFFMRVWLDGIL